MTLWRKWNSLGFYWQIYLFLIAAIGGVITLVEGMLEPAAAYFLTGLYADSPVLCESLLWMLGTVVPCLLVGLFITKMVMAKLEGLESATRNLSRGDLGVRMDEAGHKQDVFTRLAKNFNVMANSLERLVVNEKRLLADISHELRSPLTRMNLGIALLQQKRYQEDLEMSVKTLESETGQMADLVKMLLEQGRRRLLDQGNRIRIDVTELIGELVDCFQLAGEAENKPIAAKIEPGLAVNGNPMRMRMIVENILTNAMFYSPGGISIDVHARKEGKKIHFSVRDYGPGVPSQHLDDIFRAFFRVDDSRARNSGGVGLGLSLVKEAVLQMGGNVSATNAEPGLAVSLTLPEWEE